MYTVFHAFQYLKGNWSSGNKTFFLFLSMPGIIIAPNRNICYTSPTYHCFLYFAISKRQLLYFTFLINVSHAFQYLKHNCSSRKKSYFSRFYIPGMIIPSYRNNEHVVLQFYSDLLIIGFYGFSYSKVICSSGEQNFSLYLFNAWHNHSTLFYLT